MSVKLLQTPNGAGEIGPIVDHVDGRVLEEEHFGVSRIGVFVYLWSSAALLQQSRNFLITVLRALSW